MSLENQGVFQLLKEVIFRRILALFTDQSQTATTSLEVTAEDDSVCLERHSMLENLTSGMYILLIG